MHPLLAIFAPTTDVVRNAQRKAYVTLLHQHDWSHEFSDDPRAVAQGRDQLRELRMVQREIDPDYALWNQHAPEACRNGMEYH